VILILLPLSLVLLLPIAVHLDRKICIKRDIRRKAKGCILIPVPDDMRMVVNGRRVAGTCVNVCIGVSVAEGRDLKDESAHAHTGGLFDAWVCFYSFKDVKDRKTRMHELAHIFTPGHAHDKIWRRTYKSFLKGQRR
jgi:hypothetical protein